MTEKIYEYLINKTTMNVLSVQIQSIKGWFILNKKTIFVSLIVVIIGIIFSYFMNPEFTFAVILAVPNGIVYLLVKLYEASDNPSAAAFLGAFFAFMFMLLSDNIKELLEENKQDKDAISCIQIKTKKHNAPIIIENIKLARYLLAAIKEDKKGNYNIIDKFYYLDKTEDLLLSKIKSQYLRNNIIAFDYFVTLENQKIERLNYLFREQALNDKNIKEFGLAEILENLLTLLEGMANRNAKIIAISSTLLSKKARKGSKINEAYLEIEIKKAEEMMEGLKEAHGLIEK